MQADGQREMPEMVGGKLQFPTGRRALLRAGHHASIVDQHVQWTVPGCDKRSDGRPVREIQWNNVQLGVAAGQGDLPGRTLASGHVPHSQGDLSASAGQGPYRLYSDTG